MEENKLIRLMQMMMNMVTAGDRAARTVADRGGVTADCGLAEGSAGDPVADKELAYEIIRRLRFQLMMRDMVPDAGDLPRSRHASLTIAHFLVQFSFFDGG